MRFEGLVNAGGELRSKISRVWCFGGVADVMLTAAQILGYSAEDFLTTKQKWSVVWEDRGSFTVQE